MKKKVKQNILIMIGLAWVCRSFFYRCVLKRNITVVFVVVVVVVGACWVTGVVMC